MWIGHDEPVLMNFEKEPDNCLSKSSNRNWNKRCINETVEIVHGEAQLIIRKLSFLHSIYENSSRLFNDKDWALLLNSEASKVLDLKGVKPIYLCLLFYSLLFYSDSNIALCNHPKICKKYYSKVIKDIFKELFE